MTIVYQGFGVALTLAPQTIASMPSGTKTSNVVHVQVTNRDSEFQRNLGFWLEIVGVRNTTIVDNVECPFGEVLQFSGLTLNPGESLRGYADTNALLHVNVSTGEQR